MTPEQEAAHGRGDKFYMPSHPCQNGHRVLRRTTTNRCQGCDAAWNENNKSKLKEMGARKRAQNPDYNRHYYQKNKDRILQVQKRWAKENPERVRAIKRAWNQRNPEAMTKKYLNAAATRHVWHKKWRDKNPEKVRASSREWRRNNPEQVRLMRQHWRSQNPEHSRSLVRNRRARIKNASGYHTANDIAEITALQRGRCAYCAASFKRVKVSVDHIKPLSRGGSNGRANLQLVCQSCNSKKHDADPGDYARRIGRLL